MQLNIDFNIKPDVKYLGRYELNEKGLCVSWTNSGFEMNFYGNGFLLFFDSFSDGQPAYIKVITDSCEQRFSVVSGNEAVIIEGLAESNHSVKVLRVTEGETPLIIKAIRLTGENPKLNGKPEDKKLKLEFIGDSLTCGYGVMGEPSSKQFYTYEEDGTRAYASLVAQALNADATFVCASGKGMVNNCMGARGYEVPLWYDYSSRSGGAWQHSSFEPNAIIINIGTNDAWGGVDKNEFIKTSTEFLDRLRKIHPNAIILWTFGLMGTDLVSVIKEIVEGFNEKDKNTYFHETEAIFNRTDEIGGGGHPNQKAAQRLADEVVDILTNILAQK